MKIFPSKCFLLILLIGFKSSAQFSTTIPLSKDVSWGTLKNGMKYYVLHNQWPKDRVSFYFAQNVGAILENDDQNGLAHFLEHMAFNGTQNFEGKGIIDMLEKKGVRFGADINAYTAQDQTVYNLSNVPSTDDKLVDSCLLALHDWSGFLSLKEAEIDAERGVIREEWRTRRDSDFRLRLETDKALFKGSKYAKRDVIGDLNIINNFGYQVLRDYYKKWYRPDLQAVIVVGDVNVAQVEQKIIKLFSAIEMPKNPAERYYASIPKNKGIEYVLAKDKEAQETAIVLYYKKDFDKAKNAASIRKDLVDNLCADMMNRRYQEFIQNNQSSVLKMAGGASEVSRLTNSLSLYVVPKNNKTAAGFKELMIETERAVRYGFTQKELDRNKEGILSYYEDLLQNKDKISSDEFAEELVNYFLKAVPFQSIETQYENIKKSLASITLSEINQAVKKLQTADNVVLTVTGPDKVDAVYPSKEDYLDIMASVKKMPLEKYQHADTDQPLIAAELKGSKVSKEFKVDGIPAAKGYVLNNGAKIILYPTALSKDEVLFSAFSRGGSSLIKTEDIPSSQIAVGLVESSGLGKFKSTDLQDKLNGKIVSLKPYITELTEGFKGSSNQKDVETLLQLLYLYFENPRFDKDSYARMLTGFSNSLENAANANAKVFQDTISLLNSNRNKRLPIFNEAYLKQLSFEKASEIYKNRIQNAADFTFIFTGNLPDNTLSLIEKYIGSISCDSTKTENFIDNGISPADGVAKQVLIREMNVPKASVYIRFLKEFPYTYKNVFTLHILSELLSKKYMDLIREEEGGSYGVHVSSSVSRLPSDQYAMTINFDSDPEKEEKLTKIVYGQIESMQQKAAKEEDVQSVKNTVLKSRAEKVLTNSFWLGNLNSMLLNNEEFKDDTIYRKTLDEITPADIKVFAKQFFAATKTVEVIMKSKTRSADPQ
ncbi:M16 family metallopeptidase [Flavobacterium ginsenosidimutans]|uniref:M16 family metallopeptidase n=1 Tax=Flavobacterium ginsenosidimutans TaxID=687844 RepID=UPI000DADC8C9|nr:insulinase family protein [Flavobacterium ginsenosidimutans]KAF2328089.1 insulinase family protein [Flavobacterium ginsenosidimutans]